MKYAVILSFLLIGVSARTWAQTDASNLRELSERLLNLRSDVESLTQESAADNRRRQMEIDTLLQRRSELQMQILKEELRTAQIRDKVASESRRVSRQSPVSLKDRQRLEQLLGRLTEWVETSLPFRREQRLTAVQNLGLKLKTETSLEPVIAQMWSLIDKEMKLTQENAFEILEMPFEDGQFKSEVMRIGMHRLYFKRADGKTGMFKRQDGRWTAVFADDQPTRDSIDRLGQRLQKQRGHGYFELPGFETETL